MLTRRSDQLDRIEALLSSLTASSARLEEALGGHATVLRDQIASARLEVQAVKATADSAHAGVRALADMLPFAWPSPAAEDLTAAAGGGTEAGPSPASRRGARAPKGKGT